MKEKDSVQKEALFNEVKGSLFEYLVAKELALKSNTEGEFISSLDKNYLNILAQQDRMIRQYYPQMLPFLSTVSKSMAQEIIKYLGEIPHSPRVVGKFSNSLQSEEWKEADLLVYKKDQKIPISLKLNKKNAYVNTKSGGIKSFFSQYFPFLNLEIQRDFNQFVDMEFQRMALELHHLNDIDYPGNFENWILMGKSEHPGDLDEASRKILHAYYARIAQRIHSLLETAFKEFPHEFARALPVLMGFGNQSIVQAICFHHFKSSTTHELSISSFKDLEEELNHIEIKSFGDISSVELNVGSVSLHLRVKPMNKFTTTAIKMNCSVKRPSSF